MEKIMKNTFLILISFSILIFLACKKDVGLYYYPEKMAEYLELSEDQRETVFPKLTAVQEEIFGFLEKWGEKFKTPYGFETEEAMEEFEEERKAAIDKITDIVREFANLLDEQQKSKLFNVEIPSLYFEEAMMVQMNYLRGKQKKENPVVKVSPTIKKEDIPAEFPYLSELLDKWTVTFGTKTGRSGAGGFFARGVGESSPEGTGFPLKIRATIIDPLINIAQKKETNKIHEFTPDSAISYFNNIKKDILEIQVSMTTSYHESYLDLKNWIVYLENDKIEQFEPWKIQKREKPFIEHSRTFKTPIYQRKIKSPNITDTSDMKLSRIFGRSSKSAYYSISFKNKVQGKPLVAEDTKFLKLIFLKAVGTAERAEGKWIFLKRQYF